MTMQTGKRERETVGKETRSKTGEKIERLKSIKWLNLSSKKLTGHSNTAEEKPMGKEKI